MRNAKKWPSLATSPVYKHIVTVIEENKDYEQIIDEPIESDPAKAKAFAGGTDGFPIL